MHIDINCDMGEGIGNDEAIMPFITSANIACGAHAGDAETARTTMLLAKQYGVNIGAHPSFWDPRNFGRTEIETTPQEVYNLIREQLVLFQKIAEAAGAELHHVKPHGALYNMAARDAALAKAIAQAVKDFDAELVLFGLSGSASVTEASVLGLKAWNEVFADRTYGDNGSLTPRSTTGALIEQEEKTVAQVMQMIERGSVTTLSGKVIPIAADTVCIHGDGKNAVAFAKRLFETLNPNR
ncbi:MAG: LamB/YcsF family protein [Chitinophagaceae bacterium]|nr:MAG: LamB/YcsF family protein [Chitinophagaceae bacterium]